MADRYGSRRGFVLTEWYRLRALLGEYRKYRRIDWASVQRLVFVCKGNICRSAFAEAVARREGVDAISCGIDAGQGFPADRDAIAAASLKGIDLREHRTRHVRTVTLRRGDLLVAMEPWQVAILGQQFGKEFQITLAGIWGSGAGPYIRDPYGTSTGYFNHCFNTMEKSVHAIAGKIRKAKEN
jgi:protein-tyrosine phosphatase